MALKTGRGAQRWRLVGVELRTREATTGEQGCVEDMSGGAVNRWLLAEYSPAEDARARGGLVSHRKIAASPHRGNGPRSNTAARQCRRLESARNGRKMRPRRCGTEEHARLWPWTALREMASALEEAEAAIDREIGSVDDSCTHGADVAVVVRRRLVGRALIFF
ncbi:pollen-specific leucine-rich repeat extensin-like protein 3 [Iris pallida]|uniref:Pollen-specific leucine-rich repeat extensin-like protein 3 n=1 Tax=Iris pallida TaxID=29817 RepID=A0AAX6EEQ8_IRIPA|nr:pollen-specific leucine-rich repeat extensin-like protein 3 [Iris pallida]